MRTPRIGDLRSMRSAAVVAFVAGVGLLRASTASALSYTVTELVPMEGAVSLAPRALNDLGQITGDATMDDMTTHAFLWSSGVATDLGTLEDDPYSFSFGNGINSAGDVVGSSDGVAFLYSGGVMTSLSGLPVGAGSSATGINDAGQVSGISGSEAFLYSGGVMTGLGTLGGPASVAHAINQLGEVAGGSTVSVDPPMTHAFLYSGGIMHDRGELVGGGAIAWAVNDLGELAGRAGILPWPSCCEYRGFKWSNGVMTNLGSLGGADSWAFGINNAGDVVGYARLADERTNHAFIYRGGTMIDLNTLLVPEDSGYVLSSARDINNVGQIVATGSGGTGGYLLTPVGCGSGDVDPGEECDDGPANGTPASCCTDACQHALPGTACNGGVCDTSGTCGPMLACGTTPTSGCQPPPSAKAKLDLKPDKLAWKWISSTGVAYEQYGFPEASTTYLVCGYDASGLQIAATVPAGGTCGTRPCWKPLGVAGHRYRNSLGEPDGITSISLKAGAAGAARFRVKAGRSSYQSPSLPLAPPVRMQLHRNGGPCWEATYSTPFVNSSIKFKAKSD
jgi:probable HAF family extracellular repeat protein